MIPSAAWIQERIEEYQDRNKEDITSTGLLAEYLHRKLTSLLPESELVQQMRQVVRAELAVALVTLRELLNDDYAEWKTVEEIEKAQDTYDN